MAYFISVDTLNQCHWAADERNHGTSAIYLSLYIYPSPQGILITLTHYQAQLLHGSFGGKRKKKHNCLQLLGNTYFERGEYDSPG